MIKGLLKYSYFFLLFPFVLMAIVVKSNIISTFTPERVLYGYLILYFVVVFLNNKWIKYTYISIIYIASLLISFAELAYVSLYKERITTSTVFILMETNPSEMKEYFLEYFNITIMLYAVLMAFSSFFILKGVKKLVFEYSFAEVLKSVKNDLYTLVDNPLINKVKALYRWVVDVKLRKVSVLSLIFVIVSTLYFTENHYKQHVLFNVYEGYEDYQIEIKKHKSVFESNKLNSSFLSSVKVQNTESLKETYVLVIGESTTRNHLGLYNYYRETSPELEKLKKELVVFNDVISPHSHTIPTLEKVLTFGNTKKIENKYEGSIVQLMNQAGFETFWISNQTPMGMHETFVTTIAKASDYIHFTNLGDKERSISHDERVLPYLKKALNSKAQKKFIIVHLLGTHTLYENRYPKEYQKFTDNPPSKFSSGKVNETINSYDNAVLYNDYVVSEIIKEIKTNTTPDEKAMALYFSDHGEDVYETVNLSGHGEAIGSKPMFEIPFVYWSNNLEDIQRYTNYKDRKYMTDDLIYSIADLANLSFDNADYSRSIFNENFIENSRIIKSNINFDLENE